MSIESKCKKCGSGIPGGSPTAFCPSCLLGIGLQDIDPTGNSVDRVGEVHEDIEIGEIGPYRLLDTLGEGGMGTVYLAEQREPICRTVALKLIKAGMDTREVIRRFEAERQVLALMNHPGIAKVFDAGTTAAGRPYFVMELVDGVPLTDYCLERELPVLERIMLFRMVCLAVQHAHQKGIIHRDLKPSNILVKEDDSGVPIPMIIDFGIAKAMEDAGCHGTLVTVQGQILGTPQYMSPEQASAIPVDTRTDIYALGVILYELLTGITPIDPNRLQGAAIDEILRLIRDEEPERPSARLVSTLREHAASSSGFEGVRAHRWQRELKGDLEWIVLKPLNKEPERRYESVGAFSEDLGRFLRGEPIEARPPSGVYRLGKFAKRNKVLMGSIGTVAVVLIVATIVSVVLAVEATRANQLAQSRLKQADAVPSFLLNAFRQPDPTRGGADMLAVDVLDQAVTEAEKEFSEQPLIRARILESIAETYRGLGYLDRAAYVLAKAGELGGSVADADGLEERVSILQSDTFRLQGRKVDALTVSEENWRRATGEHGMDSEEALNARYEYCLNLIEMQKLGKASALVGEVLDTPGQFPNAELGLFQDVNALIRERNGDLEFARDYYEKRLGRIANPKNDPLDLMWTYSHLMRIEYGLGRFDRASELGELRLLLCRDIYQPDHMHTLSASIDLAKGYLSWGKFDAAIVVLCMMSGERGFSKKEGEGNEQIRELLDEAWRQQETPERIPELVAQAVSGELSEALCSESNLESEEGVFWLGEIAGSAGRESFVEYSKSVCRSAMLKRAESLNFDFLHRYSRLLGYSPVELGEISSEEMEPLLAVESSDPCWKDVMRFRLFEAVAEGLAQVGGGKESQDIYDMILKHLARRKQEMRTQMVVCYHRLKYHRRIVKDVDELLRYEDEMVATFSAALGVRDQSTLIMWVRKAELLERAGRSEEALKILETSFPGDSLDANPGAEQFSIWARTIWGRVLISLKKYEQAEEEIEKAWKRAVDIQGEGLITGSTVQWPAVQVAREAKRLHERWKESPEELLKWEERLLKLDSIRGSQSN